MIGVVNYKIMLKLIGINGCSKCKVTQMILDNKNIQYEYLNFNDMSLENQNFYTHMAIDNGQKTFPIIIKDNKVINISEV
jgi:glutaredoxin